METPPASNPTTEIKWPNKNNRLGDKVTYTCLQGGFIQFIDADGWKNIVTGIFTLFLSDPIRIEFLPQTQIFISLYLCNPCPNLINLSCGLNLSKTGFN